MEEEEVKEQNEIVVDNALYEAIIMTPMPKDKIPVCKSCSNVEESYREYQKKFREERGKRWKEEKGSISHDLNLFFLDSKIIDKDVLKNIRTSNLIRPEKLIRTFLGVLNDNELKNKYKDLYSQLNNDYGYLRHQLESPEARKNEISDYQKYPPEGQAACLLSYNDCKGSIPVNSTSPYSLDSLTARRELCDLYHELTQTFEMQRLKHILMTGVFPYVRSSPTHTRFSHCEGTWILGWYALTDVKVDGKPLIDFLAEEDLHREFMAALILHDIGHAPFSHVIELNPYIKYDHEDIAKEMILEGNAHKTLHSILAESIYYNRDTLYNWFGITLEDLDDWKRKYQKAYKLVHHVITDLGLDPYAIVEFFHDDGKKTKDPAIKMLRTLVSGVIDLDRIDHIYRDIHFSSYSRSHPSVRAMLNGYNFHYEKEVREGNDPFLEISKNVVPSIKSLLEAREVTHRIYKGNIENNFYIGLLNMAIADAVRINKLLEDMLPFITDEGLLYFLTDREQFNFPRAMEKIRLFHSSKNQYEKYEEKVYQIRSIYSFDEPYKIIDLDRVRKDLFELFEVSFKKDIFSTALLKHSKGGYGFSGNIDIKVGEEKFDDKRMYKTFLEGLNKTVKDERSSLLYVYFYKDDKDPISEREKEYLKKKKEIEDDIFSGSVELIEHQK